MATSQTNNRDHETAHRSSPELGVVSWVGDAKAALNLARSIKGYASDKDAAWVYILKLEEILSGIVDANRPTQKAVTETEATGVAAVSDSCPLTGSETPGRFQGKTAHEWFKLHEVMRNDFRRVVEENENLRQ